MGEAQRLGNRQAPAKGNGMWNARAIEWDEG
jgi:hypothetical protein